jgi:hypothetical protein
VELLIAVHPDPDSRLPYLMRLPLAARRAEARLAGHEHLSDGRVVVRHRELSKTMEMAERFAAELHLYAD